MTHNLIGYKCQTMGDTLTIDIFDEIGEGVDMLGNAQGYGPKRLAEQIENTTAKKITLRINSNGGDLYQGIAILNLLKASGKKVTTEVLGMAASAASIIAMAGKVRMHPTSQMMIHNCWTIACGNSKELRKVADDMDKAMDSAKLAYLEKAGEKITPELLDLMLDEETCLSAAECFELGLCDEIITSQKIEQVTGKDNQKTDIEKEKEPQDTKTSHWFFD